MIGGCDVNIVSSISIEEIVHHAAEAILSSWPQGVIEAANYNNKLLQLSDLFGIHEVFVYRDITAQRSWTVNGWTNGNCKSMIYLLAEDGMITCVLEDQNDPELQTILEAIIIKIQHD